MSVVRQTPHCCTLGKIIQHINMNLNNLDFLHLGPHNLSKPYKNISVTYTLTSRFKFSRLNIVIM